ncbi:MAG: DUF1015 domain-containing protein [Clostridiales bacterium]|nr:DUF1015 domain-containing protein [Clostridiales bacterium]
MNTQNVIVPKPILIPKKDIDYNKWSVIACDVFTSQIKYWEDLKEYIGSAPSALKLILPEAYLNDNIADRISAISAEMKKYIDDNIFEVVDSGMILAERSTKYSKRRLGLVVCVDLEQYSFNIADCSAIRASEQTIIERIPPRVKIREKALLELPHIMLLMSDPNFFVIEEAYKSQDKELLYDFELNMGGGHLKGYKINNPQKVLKAFEKISSPEAVKKTCKSSTGFVLAVGDGNHSLAAAKVNWNNVKRALPPERHQDHPARYALVEIVNIYDEGIVFHPIHRVVKNVDIRKVVSRLRAEFAMEKGKTQIIFNTRESVSIPIPDDPLDAIESVQKFLDDLKLEDENLELDYIHGEDNLREIVSSSHDSIGIILPAIPKDKFFEELSIRKVLPKKSFSLGEAEEKRYYLEAKFIK